MRTSAASATGIMCRMRFCRIARPRQATSPAWRPPRLRPSCAKGSARTGHPYGPHPCRRDRVARPVAEGKSLEANTQPMAFAATASKRGAFADVNKAAIDVVQALARLSELTIFELRGEWRLHRMPPPMRLSRDLLVRGITYK